MLLVSAFRDPITSHLISLTLPFPTAYVKAAARDIKAYLTSQGSSALIGYASVDGDEDFRGENVILLRSCPGSALLIDGSHYRAVPLANYLTCGNDTISIDLYGLSTNRRGLSLWT